MVRGHTSLSTMSQFDTAHTTSYSSLIGTIRLSCAVYEMGKESFYLCLTPPTEGFPWDDLRKFSHVGQRVHMANVHSGEEVLPKVSNPE